MLTLRADHLDAALPHAGLAGPLGQCSYVLSAMTHEQLAEAVTGPVERVRGVDFEPGRVARIVADAGSDPGVLPLLGNTLTLLWQRQQRGVPTHRAYEELGQLSGLLAQYADSIWADIPKAERETARRMFLSPSVTAGMLDAVDNLADADAHRAIGPSATGWRAGARRSARWRCGSSPIGATGPRRCTGPGRTPAGRSAGWRRSRRRGPPGRHRRRCTEGAVCRSLRQVRYGPSWSQGR